MLGTDHLRLLFAYHFDTVERMLALAANLTAEESHHTPSSGSRSIHDLLLHLLATDRSWRLALETGERPQPLQAASYADLDSLHALSNSEREAWRSLVDELTVADLTHEVELTAGGGQTYPFERWKVLHHVLLHGMQHLAEIALLLTGMGQSPGDIDFIFYR